MHIVVMLPSAVEFEYSYGISYRKRQEHIRNHFNSTSIPQIFNSYRNALLTKQQYTPHLIPFSPRATTTEMFIMVQVQLHIHLFNCISTVNLWMLLMFHCTCSAALMLLGALHRLVVTTRLRGGILTK